MVVQQRMWTYDAGRGFVPTRGIYRGEECDKCGRSDEDMYRWNGLCLCANCCPADLSLAD